MEKIKKIIDTLQLEKTNEYNKYKGFTLSHNHDKIYHQFKDLEFTYFNRQNQAEFTFYNREILAFLNYCEGDIYFYYYSNLNEFNAHIKHLYKFYEMDNIKKLTVEILSNKNFNGNKNALNNDILSIELLLNVSISQAEKYLKINDFPYCIILQEKILFDESIYQYAIPVFNKTAKIDNNKRYKASVKFVYTCNGIYDNIVNFPVRIHDYTEN
jgi:hypothetical protein